jgi:Tol biopolymer transport system component
MARVLVAVLLGVTGVWALYNRFSTTTAIRDGAPSWSPDSRRIVFYSERGGPADLWVMDADGENRKQLTATPADEGGPVFSPNGKQIAFDTDRDGNFEIYVMDEQGGNLRRLTDNPARDVSPAWSRSGKKIAFMSDRDSKPNFDIYLMNPNGTDVERVTTQDSNWFPQFSPDGLRLAFHIGRDVHVLDLTSKTLQKLTHDPANGMYPTWSKDGERIAFMSWRNGRTEIFTMNADGSNQQPIVTMPTGGAIDPRWSPDGTRIAFVHVAEATAQDAQNPNDHRIIYVVDVASGKTTRLSR